MRSETDATRRHRPRFYDVAMPSPALGVRGIAAGILVEIFGWDEMCACESTARWADGDVLVCVPSTTFEVAETLMVLAMGRLVSAKCPASAVTVRPLASVGV